MADNDNNDEQVLTSRADAAALMLAAADDRDAFELMLKQLTVGEAALMLVSAVEVGGSLVRLGDSPIGDTPTEPGATPPDRTPRRILDALIEACRT